MADAEKYAAWIVANPDKKGTPEFDTVATAYKAARAQMSPDTFAQVKAEGNVKPAPQQFVPSGEKDISYSNPELLAAHPLTRFAKGAGAPFVGGSQLLLNAVGHGEGINKTLERSEGMTRRGRKELGSEGFDWWQLGGNVASPAFLAAGAAMPVTTGAGGRIVQGMGMGALAGATEPVTDSSNDYWGTKGIQTGTGAAVGGVLPAGWEISKALGRAVRNVAQPYMGQWGADQAAGRLANHAAGDKRDALVNALKQNQTIVPGSNPTAGQIGAQEGSAEFAALQKLAAERDPSAYSIHPSGVEGQQNAARVAAIRTVGKDQNALAEAIKNRDANAREAYGAVMNDRINPASDVQIMEGAIGGRQAAKAEALRDWGRFTTEAAKQEVLANGGVVTPNVMGVSKTGQPYVVQGAGGSGNVSSSAYPVAGYPRVPARLTDNSDRIPENLKAAADAMGIAKFRQQQAEYLQNAMDSLRATVGMDDRALGKFLDRPSMKEAVKDALLSAQEKGAYFPARSGEQFSVQNLQRIKESLDAGMSAARNAEKMGRRPELSQSELRGTRDEFVSWLSNKSPGWRDARHGYATDSVPINQMQVGQELEQRLIPALSEEAKQRASAYAQALRDAPQTIKRATGQPRFDDLGQIMRPDQMETLRSVQRDMARDALSKELASAGLPAARERIGAAVPQAPAPGMFSPIISATRAGYNRLTGKATDKIMLDLAQKMRDPKEMARIMESAKPYERKALVDALMKYQAIAAQDATIGVQQ